MYIVIEGIDGAGKTELANKLEKAFVDAGVEVVRVREPGGTPLAEELRERMISGEYDDRTCYFLAWAARSDLFETVIEPALAEGKVVISDRGVWSTYAYQGIIIDDVNRMLRREPDLTILLARDVDKALASIGNRGGNDPDEYTHFENRERLLKAAERYNYRYASYSGLKERIKITFGDFNESYRRQANRAIDYAINLAANRK